MKKTLFVSLFVVGMSMALSLALSPAFAQAPAPTLPDPGAALDSVVRDVTGTGADAADAVDAAKPAAPAAAEAHKKTGWRQWWRNRQIERGPRALRPGHHRRLLRTTR